MLKGPLLVLDTMIPSHIDSALVARLAVVRREIPRDGDGGAGPGAGGRRGGDAGAPARAAAVTRGQKIAVTSARTSAGVASRGGRVPVMIWVMRKSQYVS